MSIAYLAQAGQQQQLEWLAGGTMSILLDSEATKGQLLVPGPASARAWRRPTTCTPERTRCS